MRDVTGEVVMLVVNMAVKDADMAMVHQQRHRRIAVPGRPVPFGRERKERTVGQDNDGPRGVELRQVRLQPFELRLTEDRRRLRRVVEHDEVDPLMVERVMERPAEDFEIGFATVQRRIVFAGEEAHHRGTQAGRHLLDLFQPVRRTGHRRWSV
jgi:hypothetical protein